MMKRAFICLVAQLVCMFVMGQDNKDFWLGADLSGTTMLEKQGEQLYNIKGEPRENTQLMKEYGLDAVRLRIWVNPKDGWCSKEDMLVLALRAKVLNMPVMISFHYSDFWADPAHQTIPEAWKNYSYKQMKKALAKHTKETLQLMKDHGIDVKWISIGNETSHGFLWDMGRAETNMKQYAGLTEAGYRASKKIFPKSEVLVHLDGGSDPVRYNFIFDGLKKYGVHWDLIGMSVYPYWDREAKMETSDEGTLEHAIANMNALSKKYGCDCMVVETGYEADRPADGKKFIKALIDATKNRTDHHCKGVFYWAPELEGPYKLGAFRNHRPTIIMDAFKESK